MCKNWKTLLWISLAVIVLFNSTGAQSAESKNTKQVTCTGKIIDEQGRPIAGVKVGLHEMVYDETTSSYDPKKLGEMQTGTDGAFSFKETIIDNQYRYGYIIAEKEDLALGFDNWSMRDGNKEIEIKLGPPKELSGIVVDEKDVPIPDAQMTVSLLALGEGRDRPSLHGSVANKQLTTHTDQAGKFVFSHIPAGATAEFIVKKPGKATVSTYKRTGEAYQKFNFTEGQKDIRLLLPVEAKIEGVVTEKGFGKPISGVKISCANENEVGYFRPKPLVTKTDGTFSIDSLTATRYVLELVRPRDTLPDWVAEPIEVITEAGKTKSGVKIELSKGGVLEVKVTDVVTKVPIERASFGVRNQISGRYQSSSSDKNGMACMRLTPGDYQINQIYKQGYSSQRMLDTVTIEDGKIERLEYELHGMPKITGVVRDQKNQALEGVTLKVCPRNITDNITTDAEGKFEMTYDPEGFGGSRTPVSYLICRHETHNLGAAILLEEDVRELDIKLEPGLTFTGKVEDPNGNSIHEATSLVYMRASNWGSPIARDFPKTDQQGKFEIKAIPPEQTYYLYTRAEGYGVTQTEINMDDVVNNKLDVGTIILALANLSVSGVVVDDNDEPVAGVRIYCYGDGQPHRDTQTDTEGKFILEKVCAGKMRISANKSGTTSLSGSIETEGGATDVRITISQRSSSARYIPRRPASLVGIPLPDLKALGVNLSPADIKDKKILVCFWDMQQRPSRNCVMQLARQAETLKSEGVIVVAVQASKADTKALDEWTKKYKIPFPVGMVQRSFEKARFSWGIRSLPWLILTDTQHVIRSAGTYNELNEKLRQLEGG